MTYERTRLGLAIGSQAAALGGGIGLIVNGILNQDPDSVNAGIAFNMFSAIRGIHASRSYLPALYQAQAEEENPHPTFLQITDPEQKKIHMTFYDSRSGKEMYRSTGLLFDAQSPLDER